MKVLPVFAMVIMGYDGMLRWRNRHVGWTVTSYLVEREVLVDHLSKRDKHTMSGIESKFTS